MSQHCNMSHFEKFANFGMTYGVKKSNIGYIFDVRKKSPHDVRQNYIFKGLMRGFYSLWSITKYRNTALVSKVKIQNIYLSIFSVPNLYSHPLTVYYRMYFYRENLYRICKSLISIGGR